LSTGRIDLAKAGASDSMTARLRWEGGMRLGLIAALSAACMFAVGLSALARAQAGTTGSVRGDDTTATLPDEGVFTGDAARAISDKFAACAVKRHGPAVIKALRMERDTPEQYKALRRFLDAECWGGNGLESQSTGNDVEMTTNPVAFRGALAKAVIKQNFSRHPEPFSADPVVAAGLHAVNIKFADCVVRRDPGTALQAVVAAAGTSAEGSALAALNPQMSQCLPPGVTLSFNKGTLVAYLAEAYFLEVEASKTTSDR
jgi:hypothetical protein